MKRKILIMDKNRLNREHLIVDLKFAGIEAEFFEADNGLEGLQIFNQNPDIKDVITEFDKYGRTLVLGLRIRNKYDGRILAYSSEPVNFRHEARSFGVNDYIPDGGSFQKIEFFKKYFDVIKH